MSYLFKRGKVMFFRWLATTHLYRQFLKHIAPKLRLSLYYTSMRGWKYHRGYKLLQPGDIIVAKDNLKVTTYIIGGEWAHAGICVSKDGDFECAEMTNKDYTKSTFADMCFEADRVAIIRCRDWDAEYTQKVIKNVLKYQDAKYDVEFKLGHEYLYCSELIYLSDEERRLKVNLEDLEQLGREYLSPTGLWRAENVSIIWDSDMERRHDNA